MNRWWYEKLAGQDRGHFPLGTSDARPAPGYWIDRCGLSVKEIEDAIAGLSAPKGIEGVLVKLFQSRFSDARDARLAARDYMA